MPQQDEEGLAGGRGERDRGAHQGRPHALALAVRHDRDGTHHPDPADQPAVVGEEVALAEQDVTDDLPVVGLRHERPTLDPAVGAADVFDDAALLRTAEGGVVDRADGRDVGRLLGADRDAGRGGGLRRAGGPDTPPVASVSSA